MVDSSTQGQGPTEAAQPPAPETPQEALARAIKIVGSKAAVGRHFGITSQGVGQWDECPHNRVLALEALTEGKVTRHQLRPDLYPRDAAAPAPGVAA